MYIINFAQRKAWKITEVTNTASKIRCKYFQALQLKKIKK